MSGKGADFDKIGRDVIEISPKNIFGCEIWGENSVLCWESMYTVPIRGKCSLIRLNGRLVIILA